MSGVAQQLLHAAQILTGFKEMRCERVTEQMRMNAARASPGAGPSRPPAAGWRAGPAGGRSGRRTARSHRSRPLPRVRAASAPALHGATRPTGTMRVLAALAGDAHGPIAQVHVALVQRHEFARAAGPMNRTAPSCARSRDRERVLGAESPAVAPSGPHRACAASGARPWAPECPSRGCELHCAFANQEMEERAGCRQPPLHAARPQARRRGCARRSMRTC